MKFKMYVASFLPCYIFTHNSIGGIVMDVLANVKKREV